MAPGQRPPAGDGPLPEDLRALEARLNTRRLRLKAVWLLVPFFLWFVDPTLRDLVAGATVGLVGLYVRGWAAGTIQKERELTTTGPYAFTRNPLYLGSLFLGVGITVASGYAAWTALFLVFYVGVYGRTMAGEGLLLTELFGEAYRTYASNVPAFVPRLRPYRAPGSPATGFTWARYARNKEWEALLGFVAVMGYLGVRWWLAVLPAPVPEPAPEPLFVDSGQSLGDSRVFRVVPADLDGDGDQDVLVVDFHGPSRVWTNDGGGRFTDTGQLLGEEGGHGADVADLDGDADLDVFLVHNGHPDRVLLNDGRGVLVDSGQRLGGEEEWGTTVTLADVDGDGDPDAYVTVFQGSGHLWVNDGSGRFTDGGALEGNATSVAFGDLDADGDLDAVATYSGTDDRVWLNDGAGVLRDSGARLGPADGWGFVSLGDLDADGDLDAVVTNSQVGNQVWLNDGSGAFDTSSAYFGAGFRTALGDLDGDGTLDVVAIGGGEARTGAFWLNAGRGVFTGGGTRLDLAGFLSIALADVDGDGDPDAVLGRMDDVGGSRVFLNQRPASSR